MLEGTCVVEFTAQHMFGKRTFVKVAAFFRKHPEMQRVKSGMKVLSLVDM